MVNLNNILKSTDDSEFLIDEFRIQKNCIIFDNNCIQISNISSLRLFNVKENFPTWTLLAVLVGLVLLQSWTTFILGAGLAGWGGYVIYKHIKKSQDHLLQILTNNGFTYGILSKNHEFSKQAIQIITDIINQEKTNTSYKFDMKNSVIVDNLSNSILNFQSEVDGNVSNTNE